MSAPRLSERVKREIIIAYQRGEAVRSIAERYGIHESYPGVLAKRRSIAKPAVRQTHCSSRSLRTNLTPFLSAKCLDLYHKGHDLSEIALRLRCTAALAARGLAEAMENERVEAIDAAPSRIRDAGR